MCGALVIVSAVGGGADAALRRRIISFIGPIGPIGPIGIWCERCVSCAGERLCGFLERTFGTHFLYLLLIPAQLRKCRVVMSRSTRFGVPLSVASDGE